MMRSNWRAGIYLVLAMLALVACSREEEIVSTLTPGPSPSALPTSRPTATVTAGPTPTPVITVSPTSVQRQASLSVTDQSLDNRGELVIDEVIAMQPGWLVIRADEDERPGAILGFRSIEEGRHKAVTVTIDPLLATSRLYAALHADRGDLGSFEFPGPDDEVQSDSGPVSVAFEAMLQFSLPSVSVSDQAVAEDGVITVEQAIAATQGWLSLRLDEEGVPGKVIGFIPVSAGSNENLSFTVNWWEATPTLHLVLHEDTGEANRFEYPDADPAVMVDGKPIASTFQVFLPPDIFVLDQPVVSGEIIVERATSFGPGWLVVYFDDEGGLGNIIGWAPLEDGVNEQVVVPIVEQAVTSQLHLLIHQDLETIGEFGFPRTDPPVLFNDRLPNPVTFQSSSGNFLITQDQQMPADGTVVIPLVVVDSDAWLVLRSDIDGEPGELVGLTWLPAGINRDIRVEINSDLAIVRLHAVLHQDSGTTREFNYPDGVDIPLQRNLAIVSAPFSVEPGTDQ